MTISAHSFNIALNAEGFRDSRVPEGVVVDPPPATGARNRQLHPFPADDPFNMPIGVNAWYAPTTDPATGNIRMYGCQINIRGHSHPIYLPTPGIDPIHRIINSRHGNVESYIPEENRIEPGAYLEEILQLSAHPDPVVDGFSNDRHLHIMVGNDLVETFVFVREGGNGSGIARADARRIVRNRLDRHSHRYGALANRAGTRAWGGSAVAGLIRRHEVVTVNPHIPHALAVQLRPDVGSVGGHQLGKNGQGDPSSPLFNVRQMFPASEIDGSGYPNSNGSCRMGMRFALDPTICTDAFIEANAPLLDRNTLGRPAGSKNIWQIALAKCLRDYGMIVVDQGSPNTFQCEPSYEDPMPDELVFALSGFTGPGQWDRIGDWMMTYMRRIAGGGSTPIHNPGESQWDTWRNAGHGWGGGAPRVPHSPPLASL